MRISTQYVFEQNVSSMNRQQAEFLKVGRQIATGSRVVSPADDPQAASRAIGVNQALALNAQYQDARVTVRNSLSQQESVLNSISDALVRTNTLLVQASSDTLSNTDRSSIAMELRGILENVLGQANATDGNGRYLFGGYQDGSPPFVRDLAGDVVYVGDDHVRHQRIDASRLMPVSDNGIRVFQTPPSGGAYLAEAGSGNQGSLTFKGPSVIDSQNPEFGQLFELSFAADADGIMTYSVNGGLPQTYTAEAPVNFGGLSMVLEGEPMAGDSIRVGRAAEMNSDLFATFEKMIAVLETPAESESAKAAMRNTLSTVMRELNNSMDNILTVRASVGARLNELDAVDMVAESHALNYRQTLSSLMDLDYVKAMSDYTLRQVGLEAAQKTFVDVSKLSLFSLL